MESRSISRPLVGNVSHMTIISLQPILGFIGTIKDIEVVTTTIFGLKEESAKLGEDTFE